MSKSRKEESHRLIRGTYYLSKEGFETDEIRSLILRRRLQILVHSCIYYVLNDSIVPDSTWSKWARELVDLQKKYPSIAERVDYHKSFKDFDGSTGFHLPTSLPEILNKAEYLLKLHKEESNGNTRHKADRANPKADVVRIVFPE